MCSFLLYFNKKYCLKSLESMLLSDRPPSTEYAFLPQMNTQNLFKKLNTKQKACVTLSPRCVPTGIE